MTSIDHLLEGDLDTASTIAAGILPDVVAALDVLVPQLAAGADRAALRPYYMAVDAAAQTLTSLPAGNPESHAPPAVVYRLLRRDIAELAWVAPSADGTVFLPRWSTGSGDSSVACPGNVSKRGPMSTSTASDGYWKQ